MLNVNDISYMRMGKIFSINYKSIWKCKSVRYTYIILYITYHQRVTHLWNLKLPDTYQQSTCTGTFIFKHTQQWLVLILGNAVAKWWDHSLAWNFPGLNLIRTSPVHPAVKGYPISDTARYCQNASPWVPNNRQPYCREVEMVSD